MTRRSSCFEKKERVPRREVENRYKAKFIILDFLKGVARRKANNGHKEKEGSRKSTRTRNFKRGLHRKIKKVSSGADP